MPLHHTQEEALFNAARRIDDRAERAAYLREACPDSELRKRVAALLVVNDEDHELLRSVGPAVAPTLFTDALSEHLGAMIGPYKLLEQIGSGGMGTVYMAEQKEPVRRTVALKVIKPGMHTREVIARFEAERQALAMMNHPNIAKVLDAGTTTGGEDSGFRIRDSGEERTPPLRKGGQGGGALQGDDASPANPHPAAHAAGSPGVLPLTPDPRSPTAASGRPYFVMELIRGLPITEFCDGQQLDTRERLKLFITVCQAVQHAHQKGLIHRDLKPSNVLVEMHDVTPVPKVIDFGVAKAIGQPLTEKTLHTGFHQMLGTPMYMSPEQAGQSSLDVDTRSDVYSLGVLLYELLTGTTPFDKETFAQVGLEEMRRIIREEDPARPSQRVSTLAAANISTVSKNRRLEPSRLSSSLRGELDWIVMKALEKDRARRYETANELAQDVQRYLDGEAVRACPPSAAYRFNKFARRNRIAFVTSALVAGALLLGTVVSTAQAIRATNAEQLSESRFEAEREAHVAEQEAREAAEGAKAVAQQNAASAYRQQYKAEMHAGLGDWQSGNVNRLYQTLVAHLPEPSRADLRGWEWYYLLALCQEGRILCEHQDRVTSVAWSPDGRHVATTSFDRNAIVWDARSGALVRRFSMGLTLKWGVAWNPDGQRLAWGSVGDENVVRIWDRASDEIHVLRGHTRSLISCQWSPDGRRLATTSLDNTARIWDAGTQAALHVLQAHTSTKGDGSGAGPCWTRDGKSLITVGIEGKEGVKVWDTDTGTLLRELHPEPDMTSASVSSRGPHQLVVGTNSGNLRLVSLDTWQAGPKIQAHVGTVNAVAFSPDGATFASAGADGRLSIWDAAEGRLLFALNGHQSQVTSLAWNRNGKQIASASADRSVRMWEIPAPRQPIMLAGPSERVHSVTWSKDDLLLTSVSNKDGGTTAWNRPTNTTATTTPTGEGLWQALSPDGRFKAVAVIEEGRVAIHIYDILQQKNAGKLFSELIALKALVWSPDGSRLAAFGGRLEVWDVRGMCTLFTLDGVGIYALAWAADGSRLATVGDGDPVEGGYEKNMGYVNVFDVDRRTRLFKVRLGPMRSRGTCVAWHPQGELLAAGNDDGLVMVWEAETERVIVSAQMHITTVQALDWTPDGRQIASVSDDGTLRIWDSATGDELLTLTERGESLTAVKWSADGKQLAAGDEAGRIRIWDASVGYGVFSGLAQSRIRSRMHDERGRRCIESGDLAEAVAQFSHAIELSPGRATYRQLRGLVYSRLGRLDEALADLTVAVELDPEDTAILNSRVDVYAARGEWKAALPDALRVVELKQDGFHDYRLAMIQLMLGEWEAYRDVCREMFSGDREEKETNFEFAMTCAVDRKVPVDLQAILPLARTNLIRGALLYRTGMSVEAVDPLTNASRTMEKYGETTSPFVSLPAYAWYFLAMAHHGLGHYPEALTWFEKAEAYSQATFAKPATVGVRMFRQPGSIYWHQRVVLEHLQREARTVLSVPGAKPKPDEK